MITLTLKNTSATMRCLCLCLSSLRLSNAVIENIQQYPQIHVISLGLTGHCCSLLSKKVCFKAATEAVHVHNELKTYIV